MSDYFYEKSKFYYKKYKAGKLTRKVGAIIKDGDKYLTLIKNGNKAMFSGGSVDDGETTRQAVVREVLEETGAKVTKLKYLHRDYYSVDWVYEGITFPNKRVSYIYLCEVEKDDLKAQGLDGEFDDNITLKWCTSKELEDLDLYKVDLDLVKKIERENIKV